MDPVEVQETSVTSTTTPAVPATTQAAPATTQRVGTGTAVMTESTTTRGVTYRATQFVWFIVAILDAFLAFDFIFRLAKANDTGFVNFIYGVGGALAAPFDGIFGVTITNTSYVARWGDLVAIVIYSLIGLAITALIRIMAGPRNAAASY